MSSTAYEPPYGRTNQRGAQLSRADCLRALGVDSDASWEGIQQAYKDLVRVWHPDRFQADPQLQQRAEQQLQRINEAYFALRSSHILGGRQPEPAPQPKPAGPGPSVIDQPFPRSGGDRFAWNLLFRWPVKAVWLGLICMALLVIGSLLGRTLRLSAVRAAADEWSGRARGDVAPREQAGHVDTSTVAPGRPENGSELLRARMSGGSRLWISNPASQDAVAKLVDADTASPVRVIYIQAKNKVCIRHIAPGRYDLRG
jgi:hypothetical protein